jgi:hypothetical protein
MKHGLQCRCGQVKGFVEISGVENHCLCYCKDCQAYAHFLGDASSILDEWGGSEIVQTAPARIEFTQGLGQLACMRLTGKGLLRWYARCCKTPIANTPANYKVSFAGVVHCCLAGGREAVGKSFGPISLCINTKSASAPNPPPQEGMFKGVMKILGALAAARLGGRYRNSPFFSADEGKPVAVPRVLSAEERAAIMQVL